MIKLTTEIMGKRNNEKESQADEDVILSYYHIYSLAY